MKNLSIAGLLNDLYGCGTHVGGAHGGMMRAALVDDLPTGLSRRDLRLLHAVADGRVECTGSVEPDFFIDGFACCDHMAARALVRGGMIRSAGIGGRVPVQLTTAGWAALAAAG
jgi:hypothetical protein